MIGTPHPPEGRLCYVDGAREHKQKTRSFFALKVLRIEELKIRSQAPVIPDKK